MGSPGCLPAAGGEERRPTDQRERRLRRSGGTIRHHSWHLPTDTSVWTVGLNRGSDLGLGDSKRDTYTTPQRVTTLDGLGVVQVVAASGHMLALTCTGKVYVWGSNGEGTLAMPSTDRAFTKPTLNKALSALTHGSSVGVELATGSFSADLLVHGQAYGWGNNRLDQCGCGSTAKFVSTPTPVRQNGVLFTSIYGGGNYVDDGHTVALDAAGHAYCWGDNQEGQCGVGSTGVVAVPTKVHGLPVVTQARAGGSTPCSWPPMEPSGPAAAMPSAKSETAARPTSSHRYQCWTT